ncbi:BT4734/BF3469 family protein [Akkermansia sp.]|uniref:BT4734/BF3469 family protein n=1 Tax=Akkermansia sp. TaxID=1872421 RepID=UPI0025BA635E|nr:BT4734/BF3469 family protein [Akkermansia sp.]MCC8148763.1 DUF5906 domain-containing protein [Akkermansia sp.]
MKNIYIHKYLHVTDKVGEELSLESFLDSIKNEDYKTQIELIRNAEDKAKRKQLKFDLPAVTIAGTFEGGRKDHNISSKSGFMVLDFDNEDGKEADWEGLKRKSSGMPQVAASFVSPSGQGLKIIVKIPEWESKENFTAIFNGAKQLFKRELGIPIDESGKDPARLCFFSSDANLYICPDISKLVPIEPYYKETEKAVSSKCHRKQSSGENEWDSLSEKERISEREKTVGELEQLADILLKRTGHAYIEKYEHYEKILRAAWIMWQGEGVEHLKKTKFTWDFEQNIAEKMRSFENSHALPLALVKSVRKEIDDCFCKEATKDFYFLGKVGYLQENGIHYVDLRKEDVVLKLRERGLSDKRGSKDLSEVEKAILYIQSNKLIHAVFEGYAGKKRGFHIIDCKNVIVRTQANIIEGKSGRWDTINELIDCVLGSSNNPEQKKVLLNWLKIARKRLMNPESHYKSPLLCFVGPTGSGKSLIIKRLLIPILGGRMGNPYNCMSEKTRFNGDMLGNEIQLMDDVQPNIDNSTRRGVSTRFKEFEYSNVVRIEKKGIEAFSTNPLWFFIMALNEDAKSIQAFPLLGIDMRDKVCGIFCNGEVPEMVHQDPRGFDEKIEQELPAFIDFLENEYNIEDAEDNSSVKRNGFSCYIHPEIEERLEDVGDEGRLLRHLDSLGFKEEISLTAHDWSVELQKHEYHQKMKFLSSPNYLGEMFSKLSKSHPERIKKGKRVSKGYKWTFIPCKGDELYVKQVEGTPVPF